MENIYQSRRYVDFLVKISILFCFLIFLLFRSFLAVPLVDGDQLWFYPIYISYSESGILQHPFASPISSTARDFTWHGWLQPMLFGIVSRAFGGGIEGALVTEALATIIAGILFVLLTKENPKSGLCACGLVVYLTALVYSHGRPELLAVVIVTFYLSIFDSLERNPT